MTKKIVCLLFVTALCTMVSAAGPVYVNGGLTTGANDGTSWANAYHATGTADTTGGLASALSDTDANASTVYVAQWKSGTTVKKYVPATTAGFGIGTNNNVTLMGGYISTGAGTRNVDLYETIISGDINGDDVDVDVKQDPCGLYIATSTTSIPPGTRSDNATLLGISNKTVVVDGFTLRNAKAANGAVADCGSTPNAEFKNCYFTQNIATSTGGCLKAAGGTLKLTACDFINNSSYEASSGVHCDQASASATFTLEVKNCLFSQMYALNDSGVFTIRDDNASMTGSVVFADCAFNWCHIGANVGGASGIMTYHLKGKVWTITATNVLFNDLNGYANGAAYFNDSMSPVGFSTAVTQSVTGTFTNCLFTKCGWNGCTGTPPTCMAIIARLAGSQAGSGNPLVSTNTLNMNNCTVSGNVNTTAGQGFVGAWCWGTNTNLTTTVNLKNTIVWGNVSGTNRKTNAQLLIDTGGQGFARCFLNADYCCLDTTDPNDYGYNRSMGTGNVYTNPQLDSTFRLTSSSPCRNTGNNSYVSSTDPQDIDNDSVTAEQLPVDLAMRARVASTTVDMGAFEYTGKSGSDVNQTGGVNLVDFEKLAAAWLDNNCQPYNNWCSYTDTDFSSTVDMADYNLLATNWLVP